MSVSVPLHFQHWASRPSLSSVGVEFACSPHITRVFSVYSSFLLWSKAMFPLGGEKTGTLWVPGTGLGYTCLKTYCVCALRRTDILARVDSSYVPSPAWDGLQTSPATLVWISAQKKHVDDFSFQPLV